jgi:hypothetical protein
MFSSGRCRFVVPGIGTIHGFCAPEPRQRNLTGRRVLALCDRLQQIDERPLARLKVETIDLNTSTRLMCSGRLLRRLHRVSPSARDAHANFVAITTFPRNGARASPSSSSFEWGP